MKMSTISLRMKDEDMDLLKQYVKVNNLNLSEFIRNTILDKIEDDLRINEERILRAWEEAKKEKGISHEDLWKELGDRKSTRLNSSHANISYAVFCLKKKK